MTGSARLGTMGNRAGWAVGIVLLAALFGCGGGGGSPSATATAAYAVRDVGPSEGAATAKDVNLSGSVVGIATGAESAEEAFVWVGGSARRLGGRAAHAVNDLGDVAGDSGGVAYVWEKGVPIALTYGSARGVNNVGDVVGEAVMGPGALRAFLWRAGQFFDLGSLGGELSAAYQVNDAGLVAGWAETDAGDIHAFLWGEGVMEDLGTLGGCASMAYGLNDLDQVVGYARTADGLDRAFLWDRQGGMRDLGTLGGYSVAYAADNDGRVVGESATAGHGVHAFLWRDGRMLDLNDLLPADSGWELVRALGINDAGQIVGEGLFRGTKRAFLLAPVPSN